MYEFVVKYIVQLLILGGALYIASKYEKKLPNILFIFGSYFLLTWFYYDPNQTVAEFVVAGSVAYYISRHVYFNFTPVGDMFILAAFMLWYSAFKPIVFSVKWLIS